MLENIQMRNKVEVAFRRFQQLLQGGASYTKTQGDNEDHEKRNQAFEFENDEGQRTTRPDTKAKIQVRETEEGGKSANEAQQLL